MEKYSLNKIQVWLPCAENNEMASSEGKRPVRMLPQQSSEASETNIADRNIS